MVTIAVLVFLLLLVSFAALTLFINLTIMYLKFSDSSPLQSVRIVIHVLFNAWREWWKTDAVTRLCRQLLTEWWTYATNPAYRAEVFKGAPWIAKEESR